MNEIIETLCMKNNTNRDIGVGGAIIPGVGGATIGCGVGVVAGGGIVGVGGGKRGPPGVAGAINGIPGVDGGIRAANVSSDCKIDCGVSISGWCNGVLFCNKISNKI